MHPSTVSWKLIHTGFILVKVHQQVTSDHHADNNKHGFTLSGSQVRNGQKRSLQIRVQSPYCRPLVFLRAERPSRSSFPSSPDSAGTLFIDTMVLLQTDIAIFEPTCREQTNGDMLPWNFTAMVATGKTTTTYGLKRLKDETQGLPRSLPHLYPVTGRVSDGTFANEREKKRYRHRHAKLGVFGS